jgi:sporulation protein YlmC with PRC-barrel domain
LTVSTTEEDIRGRSVRDKDGKDLGRVDDLLVDDGDRKIHFMRVESGGCLGLGETKVLIPIKAITRITNDDVSIDQTCQQVAAAPRYDPDLVDRQEYYAELYGHFRYPPSWEDSDY